MSKKTLVILFIVLGTLGILFLSYLLFINGRITTNTDGQIDPNIYENPGTLPIDEKPIPTTERVDLKGDVSGSVSVKNFFKKAQDFPGETYGVINEINYSVVYNETSQRFNVNLFAASLEELIAYRKEATLGLAKELDISPEELCKLDVVVAVPISWSQNFSESLFSNIGLSTCPKFLSE